MDDGDDADAFALLGSAVRLDVLRALADAERVHGDAAGPYDVGFSALYDAVDVDSSSAFAYHLEKLTGVFVEHTDHGYRLSDRGQRVVRAVLAGTYTERATFGPVDLDGFCPHCEHTTLRATHADDRLAIGCTDCGARLVSEELTASMVADRSDADILASVATRIRADLDQAVDGVCGSCGGQVDVTLETVDALEAPGPARVLFRGDCRACHRRVNAPIECCLFTHPAVAGFYWAHGTPIRDEPLWESLRRLDGDEWRVEATAAGYACRVTLDGEALTVIVTDEMAVTDVTAATTTGDDATTS
jgi:hypothetical protein